jgi:tRNA modification GTPase
LKTIAAIATPPAVGGIAVIRVSGPCALQIADRVFTSVSGVPLSQRRGYTASYGSFHSADGILDDGVALVFRSPKSYTGEDVAELSCHGGVYVARAVLRAVLDAGASLADPGEFTKRAFLNGKLSLSQAEAVADLIGAGNAQALGAARAQAGGALSRRIQQLRESLLNLAGHLSAWVDYPEEDIPQLEEGALADSLRQGLEVLDGLLASFDTGRFLREGIDTVIVGKPNVGKSTLMNLLAGCTRSIVTEIAGTTRDIVEDTVSLDELILRLSDTAGIRSTADPVERLGVELARSRLDTAELILAVFDGSAPLEQEDFQLLELLEGRPVIGLVNKGDLELRLSVKELEDRLDSVTVLSALEGEGLDTLKEAIRRKLGLLKLDPAGGILSTERQRECARSARGSLWEAISALEAGMTLDAVTVSLEEAISALRELDGDRVTEEVVNRVFSRFCVGK